MEKTAVIILLIAIFYVLTCIYGLLGRIAKDVKSIKDIPLARIYAQQERIRHKRALERISEGEVVGDTAKAVAGIDHSQATGDATNARSAQ